jgi:hypothetical protein
MAGAHTLSHVIQNPFPSAQVAFSGFNYGVYPAMLHSRSFATVAHRALSSSRVCVGISLRGYLLTFP